MDEREYALYLFLVNLLYHMEHDADNKVARKEFIYELKDYVEQVASQPAKDVA